MEARRRLDACAQEVIVICLLRLLLSLVAGVEGLALYGAHRYGGPVIGLVGYAVGGRVG